jgi:ADP-heptose:LPS heptosyltransferase
MPAGTILYIRCDSIGDHVLSACMLEPLRRAFPAGRIVVVAPDSIAQLYEHCPFISELIGVSFRSIGDAAFRNKIIQHLQACQAEFCLSPVYSRIELSDFLVASSRAVRRIGHRGDVSRIRPDRREACDKGYTHLINSPDEWKPELARHADFLTALGVPFAASEMTPKIWTSPVDDQFAAAIFGQHNLNPTQTIAMFAGAQLGVRKYHHYGKAIAAICQARGLKLIALGAAEDSAISSSNLRDAGVPAVNLCGQTTLHQAAAILRRCRLCIGAETGLAHIACAVGTPQVVLLGGGHFGRFMPYSPLTTVGCIPLDCFGCQWQCRFERVHCTWDLDPVVLSAAFSHALEHPPGKCPRVFCQSPAAWNHNKAPGWAWPKKLVGQMELEIWNVNEDGVARESDGV